MLIADRRGAIAAGFEAARPGDVVVLCGKGHEKTIEMADGPVPWNEANVAREELVRAGYGDGDAEGKAVGGTVRPGDGGK